MLSNRRQIRSRGTGGEGRVGKTNFHLEHSPVQYTIPHTIYSTLRDTQLSKDTYIILYTVIQSHLH